MENDHFFRNTTLGIGGGLVGGIFADLAVPQMGLPPATEHFLTQPTPLLDMSPATITGSLIGATITWGLLRLAR